MNRCEELRVKIQGITDGDYSASKREVDRLRQELGQEPLPNLQHMLEEKSAALSVPRYEPCSTKPDPVCGGF